MRLVTFGKKIETCSSCEACANPYASLVCGLCKRARYCNRDCQKAAWRQHKTQCFGRGMSSPLGERNGLTHKETKEVIESFKRTGTEQAHLTDGDRNTSVVVVAMVPTFSFHRKDVTWAPIRMPRSVYDKHSHIWGTFHSDGSFTICGLTHMEMGTVRADGAASVKEVEFALLLRK